MEASDFELVKRCLAGHQESFAELAARYKKLVYSVVYNMIPDKHEVNDISQEVSIRIYKSLNRIGILLDFKFSQNRPKTVL